MIPRPNFALGISFKKTKVENRNGLGKITRNWVLQGAAGGSWVAARFVMEHGVHCVLEKELRDTSLLLTIFINIQAN